ncbi:IclR family transcriptional regulator [Acetomicrobium hydrogeniformans]|jgi:DNA-binding IclR family transcriptional regulator|uniref:Transcriptional regulator, IclR family protein n=1 Tax=Acetomicrobium hydrogeniformans ATCC BAA-1850 TaxID=592015 RepID=A0A0T5X9I9_9BACT|nr:IclR family transcriptional regulator [Acetomicrobium hydrogeniformans]KRT35052.1 transcriptional regulator, IclR family protein [Acetomicrobium hydrogeniformans ATCC BAA-1850]
MPGVANIRVLERAVDVMNCLAELGQPSSLSEIVDKISLPKTTVFRILNTLEEHSLVVRCNGQYAIGPAVLFWASAYKGQNVLLEIAKPYLVELWDFTRETVHLISFDGEEAYYIEKLDTPHPVRMHSRIGAHLTLYCTAAGKAILASLSKEELDAYLRKTRLVSKTPNTIVDRENLMAELSKIRQEGFSKDLQENEEGICCVGAAILQNGRPVGAISVSAPAYRFQEEKMLEAGRKVQEIAAKISEALNSLPGM